MSRRTVGFLNTTLKCRLSAWFTSGTRTRYQLIMSQLLYRMSYSDNFVRWIRTIVMTLSGCLIRLAITNRDFQSRLLNTYKTDTQQFNKPCVRLVYRTSYRLLVRIKFLFMGSPKGCWHIPASIFSLLC